MKNIFIKEMRLCVTTCMTHVDRIHVSNVVFNEVESIKRWWIDLSSFQNLKILYLLFLLVLWPWIYA